MSPTWFDVSFVLVEMISVPDVSARAAGANPNVASRRETNTMARRITAHHLSGGSLAERASIVGHALRGWSIGRREQMNRRFTGAQPTRSPWDLAMRRPRRTAQNSREGVRETVFRLVRLAQGRAASTSSGKCS